MLSTQMTYPMLCLNRKGEGVGKCWIQHTIRGAWDLPEAASDHHNTFLQGPGTFRAPPGGSGTFRKQRQTTGIDSKITKIMKIDGNGLRRLEMG